MAIRPATLFKTSLKILRHPVVFGFSITAGLIFGIFLLYLSTSQAMFEHIYDKKETFPLYFAILASGFGGAALLNSRFVMKYGMFQLSLGGVLGLLITGLIMFAGAMTGGLAFLPFMFVCYGLMFCAGLIFSNLSAMAMQPLGKV